MNLAAELGVESPEVPCPAAWERSCCDGLIGDSAPHFSNPSLFCFLSMSPETHFVFILKTQQTTPLLNSARFWLSPPLSPSLLLLPGRVSASISQPLSSAFHPPHSGQMLQPRVPHLTSYFPKAKPLFWLLDLSQTGHRLPPHPSICLLPSSASDGAHHSLPHKICSCIGATAMN